MKAFYAKKNRAEMQSFILCFANKSSLIDNTPNLCVIPDVWAKHNRSSRSNFRGIITFINQSYPSPIFVTIKFYNGKKSIIKSVKYKLSRPVDFMPNAIALPPTYQIQILMMDQELDFTVPIKIDTKTLNETESLEATIGADWN